VAQLQSTNNNKSISAQAASERKAPVQILFVTIVLTMIATPFLIGQSDNIVRMILRTRTQPTYLDEVTLLDGHVVLLGFGGFGQIVSRQLDQAEINYVIITDDTEDYLRARELEKNVVYGDVSDRVLLQQVEVRKAMSTILALDDIDEANINWCWMAIARPPDSLLTRSGAPACWPGKCLNYVIWRILLEWRRPNPLRW